LASTAEADHAVEITTSNTAVDQAEKTITNTAIMTTSDTDKAMASVTVAGKSYEVRQDRGTWFFRLSREAGWTAASPEMSLLIEKQICPRGGQHEPGDDGDCAKCGEPGISTTSTVEAGAAEAHSLLGQAAQHQQLDDGRHQVQLYDHAAGKLRVGIGATVAEAVRQVRQQGGQT
jgi:hypothetical protein